MANEDYGIVIGLKHYPGIDDPDNGQPPLEGPENDAQAFYDWLIDKDGGYVPEKHVERILSSQYPMVDDLLQAKPVVTDVQNAFMRLAIQSRDNAKKGAGLRVGRRLYIFMAGHGIAPDRYGENKAEWEAALLMANAEPPNLGATFHIPGAYTASWFASNDVFDEIFLFMDCCRESALVQTMNFFLQAKGTSMKAKRCFIFGTRWSRSSREHAMPDEDNKVRGVFTKTLILGLKGAAALPVDATETGRITVASLKSYLYQNMKFFMLPGDLNDADDLQEPDIDYFPDLNNGKEFLIKNATMQRFPVTFQIPPLASGNLTIRFDGKTEIFTQPINGSNTIETTLPRGSYLAALTVNNNATLKDFDVTGIEGLANKQPLNVPI